MLQSLKKHLIPHHHNNYRPQILERGAMAGMVAMVLLTFTIANMQAVIWINVDWLISSVLPAVVVEETNDYRDDGNLSLVTRSQALDRAAELKAQHMAKNGYFAHYAPDGTSPWYWFNQVDYDFVHAGENLAVHFTDSKEVVAAWMDSPTHRANIMNGQFSEIGIGVAEGEYEGYDTLFVVQLFGTPAQTVAAATTTAEQVTVIAEQVSEPETVVADEAPLVASANESIDTVTATETTDRVPATNYELPAVEPDLVSTSAVAVVEATPVETATTTPPVEASMTLITTSTNAIPASVASDPESSRTSSLWNFFTQPQLMLQMMYLVIAGCVLLALTLSIAREWRAHHPLQVAYSFGLLLLMSGLYYVHTVATSTITIL